MIHYYMVKKVTSFLNTTEFERVVPGLFMMYSGGESPRSSYLVGWLVGRAVCLLVLDESGVVGEGESRPKGELNIVVVVVEQGINRPADVSAEYIH